MITVYARGFESLTHRRLSDFLRRRYGLLDCPQKVKLLALFRALVMEKLRQRHGKVAWKESMRWNHGLPMSLANCQRIIGGRFMNAWQPQLEALATETAAMFKEPGAGTKEAAAFVQHLSLQEFEAAIRSALAGLAQRRLLPTDRILCGAFEDYVRAWLYWLLQKKGLALDFSPPGDLGAAERRLLGFDLLRREETAVAAVGKALLLVKASLQWQDKDKARCTRGQIITAVERALGSRPGLPTPEAWQALQGYVIAMLAAKIRTQRTFLVMESPVEITLEWGAGDPPDLETAAEAWRRADWDGWRHRAEQCAEAVCRQLTRAPSAKVRLPRAFAAGTPGVGKEKRGHGVPLATRLLRSSKSRR